MREDIRPLKTLWVSGKVFDKKTTAGLPSSVELINLKTRNIISKIQTDEEGNYLTTLPVGKDYAFNVSRKGYLFYSDKVFRCRIILQTLSFNKDIPLQPLEAGAAIVLEKYFFSTPKKI